MMAYYSIFARRGTIFFTAPFLRQENGGAVVQTVENAGYETAASRLLMAVPPEDMLFGA